jgi:hypothetical protein
VKLIRTFLYTLSISLLTITTQAQVTKKPVKDSAHVPGDTTHKLVNDTTQHKPLGKTPAGPAPAPDSIYLSDGGLRIGLDISRFIIKFFQPYRTDITVQADARINPKLYGVVELGYNRTSHSDTNYTYKGNGEYATIGVDYDFLKKKETTEKNMVYGGIRYGFAHNSYEVPTYNIHSAYWGTNIQGSYPSTSITAHWIELVLGMKIEVLNNFFLGWGIREKIMIHNSSSDAFPPLVIPGWGSGTKKSQFDVNYSVSYLIPLYKVKVHVKREQKKK